MNEEAEEKITCAQLLIFLNGYDLLSMYLFTRVDVDTPTLYIHEVYFKYITPPQSAWGEKLISIL